MEVLVPIDGSPQSNAALELALERFADADLTLVHVVDPVGDDWDDPSTEAGKRFEAETELAERLFEDARAQIPADVAVETVVKRGSPWREVVACVEERDVDHVVMGSHGRDGTSRLLLGSVAELVVRRAPAPVTVVK
ncbi:universal stress protein [Natronobeatus ordinarius]|uniref:universal stress protein n=1 Tax=Natronobeatus ordinarius TaxID=2963433 RepID=UPI0020CD3C97|nr:universal stress protein [Natronobeatus ordinarius]